MMVGSPPTTPSAAHSSSVIVAIDAQTGNEFKAPISTDLQLETLRGELDRNFKINSTDQILLVGPPFKSLDAQLLATADWKNSTLFVFNKNMFADNSHLNPQSSIQFESGSIPFVPPTINLNASDKSDQMLRQALTTLHNQATEMQKDANAHILRLKNQQKALKAAKGNLLDSFQSKSVKYEESLNKLLTIRDKYRRVLDGFHNNLQRLKSVSIPRSLAESRPGSGENSEASTALSASFITGANAGGVSGVGGAGATGKSLTPSTGTTPPGTSQLFIQTFQQGALSGLEHQLSQPQALRQSQQNQQNQSQQQEIHPGPELSLIHFIPVDKEIDLSNKCQVFFRKYDEQVESLWGNFELIKKEIEAIMVDKIKEEEITTLELNISKLWANIGIAVRDLYELRNSPKEAEAKNDEIMNAYQELVNNRQRVYRLREESHLNFLESLRQISTIQGRMRFREGIALIKKLCAPNESFLHLEHIEKMPEAFEAFLLEILTRKSYNTCYRHLIEQCTNVMEHIRKLEISRRLDFMSNHGVHLPPNFFDIIPTLKSNPPYFEIRDPGDESFPDVAHDSASLAASEKAISDSQRAVFFSIYQRILEEAGIREAPAEEPTECALSPGKVEDPQLHGLRDQVEELTRRLELKCSLETQVSELASENEALRGELARSQDHVLKLNDKLNGPEMTALISTSGSNEKLISEQRELLKTKDEEIATLARQVEALQEKELEIKELVSRLDERDQAIAALDQKIVDLTARNEELTKSQAAMAQLLRGLEEAAIKRDADSQGLGTRLSELEGANSQLQKALKENIEQREQALRANNDLQAKYKAEVKMLKQDLDASRSGKDSDIRESNDKLAKFRAECNKFQRDAAQLNDKLQKANAKTQELEYSNTQLQEVNSRLKSQLIGLGEQLTEEWLPDRELSIKNWLRELRNIVDSHDNAHTGEVISNFLLELSIDLQQELGRDIVATSKFVAGDRVLFLRVNGEFVAFQCDGPNPTIFLHHDVASKIDRNVSYVVKKVVFIHPPEPDEVAHYNTQDNGFFVCDAM